jgi:hypothetical protein
MLPEPTLLNAIDKLLEEVKGSEWEEKYSGTMDEKNQTNDHLILNH